jgi:uroporphyrinogen-III synthase
VEADGSPNRRPITEPAGGHDGRVVLVGTVPIEMGGALVTVDGRPVDLAPRERAVLEVLSRRPGSVVNKSQLLAAVWKGAADGHAVEVTIGRLRRRLDGVLDIQTVPRRGYRLVAPAA